MHDPVKTFLATASVCASVTALLVTAFGVFIGEVSVMTLLVIMLAVFPGLWVIYEDFNI